MTEITRSDNKNYTTINIKETFADANKTFTDLIETFNSIEAGQINTVPIEGSWTPGQLAEHVVLSAGGFVELLNGPVKDTDRDPEQNIQGLRDLFLNFNIKMKSPDFVVPETKQYDKEELLNKLKEIETGLLKAIETLDITKTCTSFELPNSGFLTRAEAMTFTIVHTKRHVHQLKNIREKLSGK